MAHATPGMAGRDLKDICEQAERRWASKVGPGVACRSSTVVGQRPSKSGGAAGAACRACNPPASLPTLHALASAAAAAALRSPADHSGPGAAGQAAAAERLPGGCPAAAAGACRAARRRCGRLPEHVRELLSTRAGPESLWLLLSTPPALFRAVLFGCGTPAATCAHSMHSCPRHR